MKQTGVEIGNGKTTKEQEEILVLKRKLDIAIDALKICATSGSPSAIRALKEME
jgi:hypothetical protein